MLQDIKVENNNDADGNPHGGTVKGKGLDIKWQEGPLGRGDDRKEPNGTFVETVIHAAITRLEYYEDSKFKCFENAQALGHLKHALSHLANRTKGRETREVEGTHEK